jgi:hypothetical protein
MAGVPDHRRKRPAVKTVDPDGCDVVVADTVSVPADDCPHIGIALASVYS